MSGYDTCRPGDPKLGVRPEVYCKSQSPPPVYLCTRGRGHDGQHVAEGYKRVIAVWTDEPDSLRQWDGVTVPDGAA